MDVHYTDLFELIVPILATVTGNRNAYNCVYFDDILLEGHGALSRLVYIAIHGFT